MKRLAALLLFASLVIAAAAPASAQNDATTRANLTKASMLVASGRSLDASEMVQRTLQAAPPSERRSASQVATWICLYIRDLECMDEVMRTSLPLLQALSKSDVKGIDLLAALYYGVATGGPPTPEHRLIDEKLVKLATSIQDPAAYAELQILAAWQSRLASDSTAAQDHLDQALVSTLSLTGPVSVVAAYLVVTLIGELVANDDIERAFRLITAAAPMLQGLAPDSQIFYELLQLRSTLHAYSSNFAEAANELHMAMDRLDALQMRPAAKRANKARLSNYLIGLELLRGDVGAASKLLEAHPLMSTKAAILRRGYFADGNESDFALAEEFTRLMAGDTSETGWGDLLKSTPQWTADPKIVQRVSIFNQAASGLRLLRLKKPDDAHREFLEAARKRLDMLQEQYRRSPLSTPLPDWPDRVLMEFAISSTLSSAVPDYDLLVKAHTFLNRSLQTSPDDALTIEARQISDDRKQVAQALYTTRQQQVGWEATELKALVQRLSRPDTRDTGAIALDRQRIIQTGYGLIDQKQRLRTALFDGASDQGFAALADLNTVKRLLAADEALVFHVPALDQAGKVCIRRDGSYSTIERPAASVIADAKLVTAALTAEHPASNEADSQFPANEATRLARYLFGGLDDCLRASRRLYLLAPQGVLGQVPPASLLAEVPPVLGSGFDLRAAHWLIRDHSFVRTTSIGAFVATRRMAQIRRATLDYLGVADPVLAAPSANSAGEQQAARGSMSGASQALRSLPALPETSEEVKQVAGIFEKSRVRLLLGEAASEETFRLEPLSEFDVIHFATHGLVKEEVPGLKEPSLVLTPNFQDDALDDGLLTGSQIAALPLRARLAILSACNSARYEPSVIDSGIQGLSTSFAIAGVPSMVASLWPIDSFTTRDLVIDMVQASRDVGIADALAIAVRKHLDGPTARPLLHPRFWAALIVLGDGATTLGTAAATAPRDLRAFSIVGSRPSAILSSAPLGRDVVTSDVAPKGADAAAWSISRRDADGTVKWHTADSAVGGSALATAGQMIFSAGPMDHAEIRAFGSDGQSAWTHSLADTPPGAQVLRLAAGADGSVIALVGPTTRQRTEGDFSLARLDREGHEVARKTMMLPVSGILATGGALAMGEKAGLVVVNRAAYTTGKDAYKLDSLGSPIVCWEGNSAEVVLVDPTDLSARAGAYIDNFQTASAVATGDDWVLVGHSTDSCGRGARATAFRLKSDGSVELLWRDSSPFQTRADAVRIVDDAIEIVGHAQRSMGVSELLARSVSAASWQRGEEEFKSSEIFSARLSLQGREQQRDLVGAGLPIVPMGMTTAADGRNVIFGTVGPREFWMVRD